MVKSPTIQELNMMGSYSPSEINITAICESEVSENERTYNNP